MPHLLNTTTKAARIKTVYMRLHSRRPHFQPYITLRVRPCPRCRSPRWGNAVALTGGDRKA
eukprot:1125974-Lingulodinium_polyedra.AAC.1